MTSSIFLPAISSALSRAAPEMMAVPCWSSWKTGMSQLFLSASSISKHSGRLDVLEVDAAEGRREHLAEADDLLGVLGVDLDVEDVDVGEAFEEDALALHHRLAGQGADVAETEDGGAVGDHRHEIALVGVLVDQLGVAWRSRDRARRRRGCRPATDRAG